MTRSGSGGCLLLGGVLRLLPGAHGLGAVLALGACDAPPPPPVRLRVSVLAQTPDGAPVGGTRAWIDGRAQGETDAHGALSFVVSAASGTVAELLAACPAGYTTSEPERRLPVRAATGAPRPLRVRVACEPQEPVAALVVRARPGLPVLVDGQRVGQTDADGLEHLVLKVSPGATLQVSLDTSGDPRLRPQHPVETFQLAHADQVLLMDQRFERAAPRHHGRRSPRAAAPAAPGPSRPQRPQRIR